MSGIVARPSQRAAPTARDRLAPVPRRTPRKERSDVADTMFVLIPGAGGDARYWHLVVPRLQERGHDAVADSLPAGDDSAGWTAYEDSIADAIGERAGVILVAQSLAGFS